MSSDEKNEMENAINDDNKVTQIQGDANLGSDVPWWQQQYLRQLYFMMPFLFLGSTTLGYDGSLLNGLQTMDSWQDCK